MYIIVVLTLTLSGWSNAFQFYSMSFVQPKLYRSYVLSKEVLSKMHELIFNILNVFAGV